mmetsp:Transcript_4155/g.9721  ORF Transcript_4155/g.9721 Transcript_4155/m.9721 type:complete len:200 (+) Transcript_4155:820-1419(+)
MSFNTDAEVSNASLIPWNEPLSGESTFFARSHSGCKTLLMKKSVSTILFIDHRRSIAISRGDDRMGQPTWTKRFRMNCSRTRVPLLAAPVVMPVAVNACIRGCPAPSVRLTRITSKRCSQAARASDSAARWTLRWIFPVPSTCTARRRRMPATPRTFASHGLLPIAEARERVPLCRHVPYSKSARCVCKISFRTAFSAK